MPFFVNQKTKKRKSKVRRRDENGRPTEYLLRFVLIFWILLTLFRRTPLRQGPETHLAPPSPPFPIAKHDYGFSHSMKSKPSNLEKRGGC